MILSNLTFISLPDEKHYFNSMPTKYWYQQRRLKHINIFLTAKQKIELKRIVKETSDLTITRYVTRLILNHINEKRSQRDLNPRSSQ